MIQLGMTCSVCGERFVGDAARLRAVLWPHAETHPPESRPLTETGERVTFYGDEVVLSCNCGECDFCRAKETA